MGDFRSQCSLSHILSSSRRVLFRTVDSDVVALDQMDTQSIDELVHVLITNLTSKHESEGLWYPDSRKFQVIPVHGALLPGAHDPEVRHSHSGSN